MQTKKPDEIPTFWVSSSREEQRLRLAELLAVLVVRRLQNDAAGKPIAQVAELRHSKK